MTGGADCASKIMKYAWVVLLLLLACQQEQETKVYWFVPDGMRADPDVFTVFDWAEQGHLPNIKRMMGEGAYGYSIPTFPSHTPTNFATLFTGVYPDKHGVADGPMHVEGRPLNKVAVGGFSSAAKKVSPFWVTMEQDGKHVALLSMPGSTPPELNKGITVRGRWGGWGADFHATIFQQEDNHTRYERGRGSRLFFFGPPLTKYVNSTSANWTTHKAERTVLSQYGANVEVYVFDSVDDEETRFDRVSIHGQTLAEGEASEWIPITLTWQVGESRIPVETSFQARVIKIDPSGWFRIRLFYNNINEHLTKPTTTASELTHWVGPMVDFVDNFPPQLIFYPEDRQAFLDEAHASLDWHRKAAGYMLDAYDPDVFIHDIYTPNQMLTSRWWMGYVDPKGVAYDTINDQERDQKWQEVLSMYKKLDDVVGEMYKRADDNTILVLSSDHGAVPLNKWVRLNNLFAQKGWLHFTLDENGEPVIDWERSTVVYLKMAHVYIHPDGLAGNWTRASGPKYRKLREEVRQALLSLEDPFTKDRPVVAAYDWERVPQYLSLPTDRVGDLVVVNEAGFGWNEEMSEDRKIFTTPLKTGYKQAIIAHHEPGMWTPFIIMGPGVRNTKLEKPINHVDQYTTIMALLNKSVATDGRVLHEILE
ncbi:hypothetical protein CMO91_05790 [Candidatus Woesearchaeota archaeon]|nr:hypothetical protein [Candidatus Woesearchaeota archaeon]